jgi:riboflavin biosynthesis pyrimidine reductase
MRSVPTMPRASDTRWPIELLWDAGDAANATIVRGGRLPASLRSRFGGVLEIPLRADRPTVVANFVSTLDGVVALDRSGQSGGREISGGFEPDRFLMGLLRATADAVLVGAGTVRASSTRSWVPARIHPPSAPGYAEWRRNLGLRTAQPTTIVVSASGKLELDPADEPSGSVVIVTTTPGARRLHVASRSSRVEVVAITDEPRIPIRALVDFARERGFRLVLSEAGPTLFAELLAAGAIDELFLTVAPQVAGRSAQAQRLGLVESVGFSAGAAPWARLRSVMRAQDYLFLRYDFSRPDRKDVP